MTERERKLEKELERWKYAFLHEVEKSYGEQHSRLRQAAIAGDITDVENVLEIPHKAPR